MADARDAFKKKSGVEADVIDKSRGVAKGGVAGLGLDFARKLDSTSGNHLEGNPAAALLADRQTNVP